jgi:hypothetical protein
VAQDKPPTHDERGKFAKGNVIPRKRGLPPEVKFMRENLKAAVIATAHELLDPAIDVKKADLKTQTKLQYLVNRAVSTGNYKFIQYLLDQAIGKAITPVIAKVEGDVKPRTIIRRTDGSVVEYSLDEQEKKDDN